MWWSGQLGQTSNFEVQSWDKLQTLKFKEPTFPKNMKWTAPFIFQGKNNAIGDQLTSTLGPKFQNSIKKPFYHVCINDLKICKQQSCKRMPIHAQLLIQGCEEITTINKKDVKGMSAINTSDDQSHQESLLIARLLGRRLWNLPGIRRSSKRKRPQDF